MANQDMHFHNWFANNFYSSHGERQLFMETLAKMAEEAGDYEMAAAAYLTATSIKAEEEKEKEKGKEMNVTNKADMPKISPLKADMVD